MNKQKNIDTPDHLRTIDQSAQYFKEKFGEKAIESVKEIMKINALVFDKNDANANGMPPNCSYEYWHDVQTILEQDTKNGQVRKIEWTDEDTKRVEDLWKQISGEDIKVEFISGSYYGYCSELASLRLLKKYRNNENASCHGSENLQTFHFCLKIK